jgi:pimeloyl-ACP methyl ester carboxylesterase
MTQPTAIEHGYSRTPFGHVHYWVTGSGPTLTAIHQSAQSSDEYLGLAHALADSFRVIGIDLPGHGKSETPDHELEVEELTDAAAAVLNDLGVTRTHVVGHHGGVLICVDLANRYPALVDKAILSGGGTRDPAQFEALKKTPMTRDLPVDAAGEFLAQTWAVYRRMSATSTPPEVTMQPFVIGLQARQRPYDMHHALYRWDGDAAHAAFTKQTLFMRGLEDLYSGDVRARYDQHGNCSYVEIPDGGAWLFYEQPEACAAAIRSFLEQD